MTRIDSDLNGQHHSDQLRITEIFFSLQGESVSVGCPTTFIRLTGCPMRCLYCDSAYAFKGGQHLSIDDILLNVSKYPAKYVTVTGGEPLAQTACVKLLQRLADAGYQVSLETGGACSVQSVPEAISIVLDVKTPASGAMGQMEWSNINMLRAGDQIKFVLCNRADYEWAKAFLQKEKLNQDCTILFSAAQPDLPARDLADWILKDGLDVRFQMQLHKLLWGDEPGR